MAYTCKDCSYSGVTKGEGGSCPACGSFNIRSKRRADEGKQAPKKWRFRVMIALWVYFVALIIWKLNP